MTICSNDYLALLLALISQPQSIYDFHTYGFPMEA